jgi:hypothetical protein
LSFSKATTEVDDGDNDNNKKEEKDQKGAARTRRAVAYSTDRRFVSGPLSEEWFSFEERLDLEHVRMWINVCLMTLVPASSASMVIAERSGRSGPSSDSNPTNPKKKIASTKLLKFICDILNGAPDCNSVGLDDILSRDEAFRWRCPKSMEEGDEKAKEKEEEEEGTSR